MWKKYFKVVGIVPGPVIIYGFGTVDFSRDDLPVELCKQLFEADSRYLKITPEGKEKLYGIKQPKATIVKVEEPTEKIVTTVKRTRKKKPASSDT